MGHCWIARGGGVLKRKHKSCFSETVELTFMGVWDPSAQERCYNLLFTRFKPFMRLRRLLMWVGLPSQSVCDRTGIFRTTQNENTPCLTHTEKAAVRYL